VVSDSKSKHGGFYRKGPAVRSRLDRPLRNGQACGGFLDFMHFFIAYQGTTITLYSEIGNDQRESTYTCFFEQGFKQNLVAMILKLLRSIIDSKHVYRDNRFLLLHTIKIVPTDFYNVKIFVY